MSDLASLTFLSEMAAHKMVVDITVIGHGDGSGMYGGYNFVLHLALADRTTIFGDGISLQEAIDNTYTKFRAKQNQHRN